VETTIRENGGDALRFLIRFFRGSLNNELAMSVRGRSGEEEAQEGDRQTEELQVFNPTFIICLRPQLHRRVFFSFVCFSS
jgi:hypothetical protein